MKAQDMNNTRLATILYAVSDELEGQNGRWQFSIDSVIFMCMTDELHNRMRFIAPIAKIQDVTDEQIRKCMEANFHTTLDSKYAISDDILWAVYIHPLKELTEEQVVSGLSQVYSSLKTFGTTYSSGSLSFPTSDENNARRN